MIWKYPGAPVTPDPSRSWNGREQEAAVPEFVAEIVGAPGFVRFAVRGPDESPAGDGLEQRQVRGLGVVPASDQPADNPRRVLGSEHEVGPSVTGHDGAVGRGALQRAGDCC